MLYRLPRTTLAALVCLIAATGLVACGGGGDDASDEDQITEAANRAFVEADPAICDEIATDNFVEQFFGGSIEDCKKDAEDGSDNPDSVEVSELEIDGDGATATITQVGGESDGSALGFVLVKEDGDWKFDGVEENALSELFFQTVRGQVIEEGLSEQVADCIEKELRAELTPEELEQIKMGARPPSVGAKATAAGRKCGKQAAQG